MFYDQEKRRRYDIKMNVEQALNIVKQSLETYIGTPSINALQLFINGFLYNNLSYRNYPIDECFMWGFHDWARRKIEEGKGIIFDLDVGYDDYIEAVCENGEQEIALFFELCEEFFEEMRNFKLIDGDIT